MSAEVEGGSGYRLEDVRGTARVATTEQGGHPSTMAGTSVCCATINPTKFAHNKGSFD